jgi:hypothetical protein
VGLIKRNPGHAIAEEVLPFATLDRRRREIERRRDDALPRTIDQPEPHDMPRMRDRRRLVVDRFLAKVVDHPSESQGTSERMWVVK